MTIKELSQLYWLNREIEEEKQKLCELEAAAVGCTAKITGLPHVDRVSDKTGGYAVLIAEQKNLIDLKIRQSVIEYNRLNRYIDSVEDSLTRQIMSLRFVKGLSWSQVAASVGGGNTEDSVKKAIYRFVKKK